MYYSYLCCKKGFIESKKKSMHFHNLIANSSIRTESGLIWLQGFLYGNLCTHCWRFTTNLEHDVPQVFRKKNPLICT